MAWLVSRVVEGLLWLFLDMDAADVRGLIKDAYLVLGAHTHMHGVCTRCRVKTAVHGK